MPDRKKANVFARGVKIDVGTNCVRPNLRIITNVINVCGAAWKPHPTDDEAPAKLWRANAVRPYG